MLINLCQHILYEKSIMISFLVFQERYLEHGLMLQADRISTRKNAGTPFIYSKNIGLLLLKFDDGC